MKVKSITIELDVNIVSGISNIIKINIGEVMTKYNFSIIEKSNTEKLLMVAKELLNIDRIIIGFACYNLNEIIFLNNELNKNNNSLESVYIPSNERIELRKAEALENVNLHGRWIGSSEREVEENFKNFRITLLEIKDGLRETPINVIEM
jgi:hypothetical protein